MGMSEDVAVVGTMDAPRTVDKGKTKQVAGPKALDMDSLPWVEKYRPATLDDVVAHQDIISTSAYRPWSSSFAALITFCRHSSRPVHHQESIPSFAVLWSAWDR